MQSFKNEFVTIFVPNLTLVTYTVQTYDDINSVYIYNNSLSTEIGINSPDYLAGTLRIRPGDYYIIDGNAKEKLNAPIVIYCDNIGHGSGEYINLIIKRFV